MGDSDSTPAVDLLVKIGALQERIAELEDALRAIAKHPHIKDGCSNRIDETAYNLGLANGHRCAAEIGRLLGLTRNDVTAVLAEMWLGRL